MNTIKTAVLTLTLMTTMSFADFTIKDLFTSGGTQTTEDGAKDKHDEKTHEDCI